MFRYRTILIAEDDPALLVGLRDNFEFKGARVVTAESGHTARESALALNPDLIVLDIMLPGLSGYEVCHELRQAGVDTPILMLTAKGEEEDIIRGLQLGADDYVTKPFRIRELLARAQSLLRRCPAGERLRFGDCDFDMAAHQLFRHGVEVPLSPKEFQLLRFFVMNGQRALSRDDILDRVWGQSVTVTSRSVDRCVTTLRAKIEPDPTRPVLIRTVRDVGYRFEFPETGDGV